VSRVFVPLHCVSELSIGRGVATITELVQHARRLGFSCIGLTDVETLRGQVQFHAACRAHGVKPLTGLELRLRWGGTHLHGARLVIVVTDRTGYAGLCRLLGEWNRATNPREPLEHLERLTSGAFILTDHPDLLRAARVVLGPGRLRALLVRPAKSTASERRLVATARDLGVPLVADLDVLLTRSGDWPLARLIRAVYLGRGLDALPAPPEPSSGARTLCDPAAARALFEVVPEAVAEGLAIADACELDLVGLGGALARESPADAAVLAARTRQALDALPGAARRRADYTRRLDAELAVVREMRLDGLFTTVAAVVEQARLRSIPVAARGSAVGSLIGHLLGLSPIDPLEHGLYFERFAHPGRRAPPDIDLDVASRRRDELIAWLLDWCGPERAARLSSVHTFARRSAYREGLRALGAPRGVIERYLRELPPDELGPAAPSEVPRLPPVFQRQRALLERLLGKPRHLALHPGGVVVSASPLTELVPVAPLGDELASQYDAASLAALGLCKVDLLGSHCLDELAQTWSLLGARRRAPAGSTRASDVPLDDPETLSAIDRAETVGCFQLESPATRAVLARLPVRSIADVSRALAIVRPGPASGHAKELFLARANGEQRLPELYPALRERLAPAQGLLLYEEDILFVLATLGGLSLAEADAVRQRLLERGDDQPWVQRLRARWIERAFQRGVPRVVVEDAWSSVVRFVRYSFSAAHAASQAWLGYQMAFLARHAPLELGCALLDHHAGLYPRRVLGAELMRRGVRLLTPSLTDSELGCQVRRVPGAEGEGIRLGLALVKGLRRTTRQQLLLSRTERPWANVAELLARVPLRRSELTALIWSGACDPLLDLTPDDYPWVHEALLEAVAGGRGAGLRAVIERARAALPSAPSARLERYRALYRVQRELETLELYASAHPMHVLRSEAERLRCVPSHRLREHAGQRVRFAGIIAATRRVAIAAEDVTQFMTLEDEHGLVEARLPPAAYSRLGSRLATPGPFLVVARVRERHAAVHLDVDALSPFHERQGRPGERWDDPL
jgi:DNA polymerase III alpha subunit